MILYKKRIVSHFTMSYTISNIKTHRKKSQQYLYTKLFKQKSGKTAGANVTPNGITSYSKLVKFMVKLHVRLQ